MEPSAQAPEAAALAVYGMTEDGGLERDGRMFELPPEPEPSGVVTFESEYGHLEMAIPFSPQPFGAFGPDLDYWISDGSARDDGYRIHRISLEDGKRLLTIKRRFSPSAIPDSIRAAAAESFRSEAEGAGTPSVALDVDIVPRHYPPFHAFFLSTDGTLWVRRIFPDGLHGFDVFAPDGRYLGRPELSAEIGMMRIQSITATGIYAVDSDELGVNRVVRLDIERPPGSLGMSNAESAPFDSTDR